MNAIRELPTAEEISIRLQTNEVLVHLPTDTALSSVPQAIYEAGYAPDENIWLLARGRWTDGGFLPSGWSEPIPTSDFSGDDGLWQVHFKKSGKDWTFVEAEPVEKLPSIEDEV